MEADEIVEPVSRAPLAERVRGFFVSRNLPYPLTPLAVAGALLLLIVVGFAFLGGPQDFTVIVSTADGPVDGATVQVFDGDELLDVRVTAANGRATFSSLPAKDLRVVVEKDQLKVERTANPSQRVSLSVRLGAEDGVGGPAGRGIVLKLIDAKTAAPVADARVSFTAGQASGSVISDARGEFRVDVPENTLTTLRVTHVQFAPAVLKIVVRSGAPSIHLTRLSDAAASFAEGEVDEALAFATSGSAVVIVTNEAGGPVGAGEASLVDSFSHETLATAPVEFGLASFDSLELGVTAYPKITADGFLDYVGEADVQQIGGTTVFQALLQAEAPGLKAETPFSLATEDGEPATAQLFVLIPPALRVAQETLASGETKPVELAIENVYYAVAVAPGYLPSRTPDFQAGSQISFTLRKATAANSGSLALVLVDADGNPVAGATVLIETLDGRFVLPGKQTDSQGRASFADVPFGDYAIKGAKAAQRGSAALSFAFDAEYILQLETAPAVLTASAVDNSTNRTVAAEFTSEYLNPDGAWVQTAKCSSTASAPCTLLARSKAVSRVRVSAPGFLPFAQQFSFEPGEERAFRADLTPSVLVRGVSVSYAGAVDRNGNPAALLKAGGVYTLSFTVQAEQGLDATGFALRVGAERTSAESKAFILDGGFPFSADALRAASYEPGANCSDAENPPQTSELKWVDLRFDGPGTHQVEVKVKVRETATTGSKVTAFYRAYGIRGAGFVRDPPDPQLGANENSAQKSGCYANAKEKAFDVITATPPDGVQGTADFTAGAAITADPQTGQLLASERVLRMQVDALYPADAIPLVVSRDLIALPVRSLADPDDPLQPNTAGCYSLEPRPHADADKQTLLLVFKANELNPQCPIRTRVNDIRGDDTAQVEFQSVRDPGRSLTLDVRVTGRSATTVYAKPKVLSGGEATAKLIFIISQKQAPRQLQLDGQTGQPGLFFSGSDAHVFGWNGEPDGVLSLSEDNLPIWEWSYSSEQQYFSGVAGMCAPLKGDANHFAACADGCCTRNQFKQAIQHFITAAEDAAKRSAFRRGDGQPFNTLNPNQDFVFTTIVQLRAGVSLKDAGISIQGPEAPADLPSVYTIRARSRDGKSFTYSADIATLNWEDYVVRPPAGSGQTGVPCQQSQQLVGYAFGDGNCVKTAAHQPLWGEGQGKEDKEKPIVIPSLFVQPFIYKGACAAADAVYQAEKNALKGACSMPHVHPVAQRILEKTRQSCLDAGSTAIACDGVVASEVASLAASINALCERQYNSPADVALCITETTGCMTALEAASIAAVACEKVGTPTVVTPAGHSSLMFQIPLAYRLARYACFASSQGCVSVCDRVSPYVLILPILDTTYYFISMGLDTACKPKFPIAGSLLALAYGTLNKKVGPFANLIPAITGIMVMANAKGGTEAIFSKKAEGKPRKLLPIIKADALTARAQLEAEGATDDAEDGIFARLSVAMEDPAIIAALGRAVGAPAFAQLASAEVAAQTGGQVQTNQQTGEVVVTTPTPTPSPNPT